MQFNDKENSEGIIVKHRFDVELKNVFIILSLQFFKNIFYGHLQVFPEIEQVTKIFR